MIRLLFSKYRYSVARFIILTLVMCLATSFLSLGIQLYVQSVDSVKNIQQNTTTIVLLRDPSEAEKLGYSSEYQKNAWMTRNENLLNKAAESSVVLGYHKGTTLAARIDGYGPVFPTAEYNQKHYEYATTKLLARAQLSAFRIRVEEKYYEEFNTLWNRSAMIDGKWEDMTVVKELLNCTYRITVLETLIANDQQYKISEEAYVYCIHRADDGSELLEVGKEYILFAQYNDLPPIRERHPIKGSYLADNYNPDTLSFDPLPSYFLTEYNFPDGYSFWQDEEGKWFAARKLPEISNKYPTCLTVDDPRVEEMLAWVKLNSEMVDITGISTVKALPVFTWEDAYITQGRDITRQENEEGAKVCLVSTNFADYHGLEIGDQLPMDLYQAEWHIEDSGQHFAYPYAGEMEPAASETYTIVGIYYAPEWVFSKYTFSPNTIFVPEGSISIEGQTGLKYATSLLIENGSNEQFMDEIKAMGMDETNFMIYDGGYMEFMESLKLMRQDTLTVLIVCALLYLVIVFSAVYMMVNHLKLDAGIMQKVGATKRYAIRYMLGCIIPLSVLAAILAYGISCLVHKPVIETLENWYTLVRPAHSNLSTGSTGMLTETMRKYPSLIGLYLGILVPCIMSAGLTFSANKRKGLKE